MPRYEEGPRSIWIGGNFESWVIGYRHPAPPVQTDCGIDLDPDGATYVNDAAITYELRDASGTPVSGGSGSYTYQAGTQGNYLAAIPDAVTSLLTENALYDLVITARESGQIVAVYHDKRRARKRGAC